MSPGQRRSAIVRAASPLLAEHGANVTTKQIARAAGIAEGTVFRVFTDKDELVRTCVLEALRTDELRTRISELVSEPDLYDRLTEAGVLIVRYFERLGALMQALATSGYDLREHHSGSGGHEGFIDELVSTLSTLLAPDRDRLRHEVDDLARMALALLIGVRFDPHERDARTCVAMRVDTLLRGALRSPEPANQHWGGTDE